MLKLDIPLDPKEQAAIDRRRAAEYARTQRIMNPRQMKMGLDYQGLANQVVERKGAEADTEMREAMYAQQMNRQDRLLQMMERRQQADARALNKAVVEYRQQNQRPEQRREFDLNDPEALLNEVVPPLRNGGDDSDARLGIASMQHFEGEDIGASDRDQLQKQQMREWVAEAEAEHANNTAREANEKAQRDATLAAQIQQTQYQMSEQDRLRKEDYMQTRAFNKQLMDEKEAKQIADDQARQQADFTDVINAVNSDLLEDTPAGGYDQYGRVRHTKHFRGFLPQQVDEVRQTQGTQRVENDQKRQAEQALETEYQNLEASHARMVHLAERQTERDRRQSQQDLNATNTYVQKTRQTHCIGQNTVGGGFFAQFGTGSR